MAREYVLQKFRPEVNLHIDYRKELNDQQWAAVTAPPGPALVIAGAGSGKTRTLTYRVAFLLEQGIPADRILLLTFTNKAAREMMRRVADLLGTEMPDLWGGTFHAIGARILRRHAEPLGYRPDFTIMDREDAEALLKVCVAASGVDVKATRFPKPEVLANILSLSINTGRSIPQVLGEDYEYFVHLTPQVTALAGAYQERKRATNNMDFDDLLAQWLRLLREQPEIRELYQRRFQFILVDEYQDTNTLQAEIIDLLAARHRNVMVVGDDSQSIYAWRGANFRNILEFPERYPGAPVYKIETNYRSTPEILQVANAAIAANVLQFTKQLTPARKSGPKPALVSCPTAEDQAAFVAQRVLELREEGVALDRMAVLYRSHFHALELQIELTRRNIPFTITSGMRFFEQAHIKDVAAFLKWVVNPADELSFKRLVLMLPGVGAKAAEKLWTAFTARGVTVAGQPCPLAAALQACQSSVPRKAAAAWAQFTATISQIESPEVRAQPARAIQLALEAGYEDYLHDNYSNARSRMEDLEQLASFALQFKSTDEFLTQLSLLTNLEAEDDRQNRQGDEEQLRLSTIHQAKGLEFDVVFITMLCDGLFPSARSLESREGEEEERRLFYVAITRARNELYLTYPLLRLTPGQSRDLLQQPSRFLSEIPPGLVDQWTLKSSSAHYL